MSRCLDCGAERETDQCLACGLTSLAAGGNAAKRLVRRTAWFLVGAIVLLASQAFPPLNILASVSAGVLFFVVLGLALWIVNRARKRPGYPRSSSA